MFQFKKNGMKILKIFHLFAACCWIGGAVALLALNLNSPAATEEGVLFGLNSAAHLVDIWVVVIPGALGCLLTGLLYALFTPWGFFRHKWLILKWILTLACVMSGTFLLGEWEGAMLDMSRELGPAALQDPGYLAIKARHMGMGMAQIVSLFAVLALSVLKPGRRRTS